MPKTSEIKAINKTGKTPTIKINFLSNLTKKTVYAIIVFIIEKAKGASR